jgi:transcriptional antiterminator
MASENKTALPEAQMIIFQLMKSDPGISPAAIAEQIGMALRNVQVHIQT